MSFLVWYLPGTDYCNSPRRMTENTAEQQAPRSLKCERRHYLVVLTVCAVLCIVSGVAGIALIFVLFCPTCPSPNSLSVWIYGTAVVLLFLLAVLILLIISLRYKRGQNDLTGSSTPEVADDLENSTASLLRCNHVLHRFSFSEVSSIHLSDYLTAVQSTENVYSSDVPDTPPPCYEEVVEMTISAAAAVAAASEEETHSPVQLGNTADLIQDYNAHNICYL